MSSSDFLSSIPLVGGLFDDSQQNAMDQLKKNQQLYGSIQSPVFQDYKPAEYDPTMAQATTISQDPMIRSAQMSALNKMAGFANTGLSDVDQQGFEKARQLGNQISSSGTAAALQNAQARGVGGSGLEFGMREQASQDAANRAQNAGLDQAAQSAQQRAMYNQAYGSGLANMRGQDYQQNAGNASILNNFNQYNTSAKNQGSQYNVGQQNYAQQYNNELKQQGFADQMKKAGGQAGANTGMGEAYGAENASNSANRNSNTGILAAGAGAAMGGDTGASGKGNGWDRFSGNYGG